ncbi:MAG: hypothetical protein P9X22_08605 [Candidatus Zapsychrus exili]|nr:hypothetical protein [Candidatus Zapsychrus exili]
MSLLNWLFPSKKRVKELENRLRLIEDRFKLAENRLELIVQVQNRPSASKETTRQRIISFLTAPHTTSETAEFIGESRSWISLLINQLQKQGKLESVDRTKQGKLYKST